MKRVARCLGYGVVVLLMMVAVLSFLAPRFGWRIYAVSSGSMEPQLKVGGMVLTRPVASQDIEVGDTITFYSPLNKQQTVHRVVAVEDTPSLFFRTKGDANESPDPFVVPAENVAGKVYFHILYLGYATQFLKVPSVLLLTLILPGLAIIAIETRSIWKVLAEQDSQKHTHEHVG